MRATPGCEGGLPGLKRISHIVLDVDGTLTDGGIYYDEQGNELKKFNTRDGAGFFAARHAGIRVIVLTGRESLSVSRRMKDFQVDVVRQNIKDKRAWLRDYMAEHGIRREEAAYVGDDLNDLAAMRLTCFAACPLDACAEVKAEAQYISGRKGGEGVFRDVVELILKERGQWDETAKAVYNFD
jgi:3-deoxy-D-manno-octulosonate 8-phosphate phosphatase (KDO 8-P phosphatase)